jgi:hypothetical protein
MYILNPYQIHTGEGRSALNLLCVPAGADLIVYISGGVEHIGAVGLGYCYNHADRKANSSVIAISGHKEDDLVKSISQKLSKALKTTVAVIAGVHYDNMTKSEIHTIIENANNLADELIRLLISQSLDNNE